jgi:hypothetical protein
MKKSLLVLCALAAALLSFAQPNQQVPPPGAGKTAPAIGRIYGRLVDSAGKSIRDASIVVLQARKDSTSGNMKDVLVRGVSAATNGDFNLEDCRSQDPLS